MAARVEVNPALISWARARSRIDARALSRRFPRLGDWERGEVHPTLKQLEQLATATRTPVGYLFLDEPPEESVPIPDFRTIAGAGVAEPSPDLLATIYRCQQRQAWYRAFALEEQLEPVAFVGSLDPSTSVLDAAASMRGALDFTPQHRGSTTGEGARILATAAEDTGVLVMVNGIVDSNTHRVLDPEEFRGFALVDPYAPLVFVNGTDTKAAQIFTLAHELAHLWIGQTALSGTSVAEPHEPDAERWCNQVAAEFLVPLDSVRGGFNSRADLTAELERLTKVYKVSTLVILRRIHEAGFLDTVEYRTAYLNEEERVLALMARRKRDRGGNFYNTELSRVGKRFARAVVSSTLEGRTQYSEATTLLGFRKATTFERLADRLGFT